MKYSELPKAYKELADKHNPRLPRFQRSGNMLQFSETYEGHNFWREVHLAKDESELPPLPKEKRIEQLEKRIEKLERKLPSAYNWAIDRIKVASGTPLHSSKPTGKNPTKKPFEVGDYVVVIQENYVYEGEMCKITHVVDESIWPIRVRYLDLNSTDRFCEKELRHATEEEIEQATRNTVGDYEISEGDEYNELYNGSLRWGKKTKIGCEQFRPSFIDRLKRLLSDQDVRIILEGEDVTQDIIDL